MRFTEHEMTTAVTGVAKRLMADQAARGIGAQVQEDVEATFAALTAYHRYEILSEIGGAVLSALVALPDVVLAHGQRASYSDEEVATAVADLVRLDFARHATGQRNPDPDLVDTVWSPLSPAIQRGLVAARVSLIQAALAAMPLRNDPETLVVPDTLEGL